MHWLKKAIYILVASSFLYACKDESLAQNVDAKKDFLSAINSKPFDSIKISYHTLPIDSIFKQKYPTVKNSSHIEIYFPNISWKAILLKNLDRIAHQTNTKPNFSIWRNKSSLRRYFLYNYPPDTSIIVLEIFQ